MENEAPVDTIPTPARDHSSGLKLTKDQLVMGSKLVCFRLAQKSVF